MGIGTQNVISSAGVKSSLRLIPKTYEISSLGDCSDVTQAPEFHHIKLRSYHCHNHPCLKRVYLSIKKQFLLEVNFNILRPEREHLEDTNNFVFSGPTAINKTKQLFNHYLCN